MKGFDQVPAQLRLLKAYDRGRFDAFRYYRAATEAALGNEAAEDLFRKILEWSKTNPEPKPGLEKI